MSNLERDPAEQRCGAHAPDPLLLEPREVPLGGPRAMTVRRTLPHKRIRTVGAWCFVDHYGPQEHRMAVPPHPHAGLQTVSWLLAGEVDHRDSIGSVQRVRPGELNVMTAGHGIAHSEYSAGEGILHGVQLWVALTDAHRERAPAFEHHADLPVVEQEGMRATVMVGDLGGVVSPASVYSPLMGAEVRLDGVAGLPLHPWFEYAVLALDADVEADGYRVAHGAMQYLGWGRSSLTLNSEHPARVLVLGGEPLTEDLLMWWNFVGRSHDEMVRARRQWQAADPRFGEVAGDPRPRLPAPALPTVALKPRPSRR